MASNVERLQGLSARFNETGELDFTGVHPDVELHEESYATARALDEGEGIERVPEEAS